MYQSARFSVRELPAIGRYRQNRPSVVDFGRRRLIEGQIDRQIDRRQSLREKKKEEEEEKKEEEEEKKKEVPPFPAPSSPAWYTKVPSCAEHTSSLPNVPLIPSSMEKWSGRKRRQRRHEVMEDGAIRLQGGGGFREEEETEDLAEKISKGNNKRRKITIKNKKRMVGVSDDRLIAWYLRFLTIKLDGKSGSTELLTVLPVPDRTGQFGVLGDRIIAQLLVCGPLATWRYHQNRPSAIDFGRQHWISAVGSRLREKSTVGGRLREKKKKRKRRKKYLLSPHRPRPCAVAALTRVRFFSCVRRRNVSPLREKDLGDVTPFFKIY
ncbi:hypothetical protein BHM03_00016873 [Ensete ventricosum]|nr:hypothetical protein BHM03_00016873 [Ensete ventricosum]